MNRNPYLAWKNLLQETNYLIIFDQGEYERIWRTEEYEIGWDNIFNITRAEN